MNEVVVLLGSNLGDGSALFQQATDLLEKEVGKRIMHSSIYKSPPWGFEHDNDFLNQVLVLETNYDPEKVLIICLSIEEKMGRVKSSKKEYEPRTIDIDLLFMEDKNYSYQRFKPASSSTAFTENLCLTSSGANA